MYGLVMFDMGLVLLEMIRVPPYQNSYFTWLVDRTTPEYLRSQYDAVSGNHTIHPLRMNAAYCRQRIGRESCDAWKV